MFKDIISNYRKNGFKYFTPKRAWLWLRSKVRKITGGVKIKEKHAIAFSEIVTYKALTCPDCVLLGKCRICDCPINELFVAMDAGCSDGKFPEFKESIDFGTAFQYIKEGEFKKGFKWIFRKRPHWSENWKDYKEQQGINLMKIYG